MKKLTNVYQIKDMETGETHTSNELLSLILLIHKTMPTRCQTIKERQGAIKNAKSYQKRLDKNIDNISEYYGWELIRLS